ncbi:energy-coupling factor transporter transmembrane component T family protein [Mycoplasma sp. P36-A1]|uniref:energy-coupling factor transporter transmembrane component T family protein n=1 Tax=Mycoplasma sp. P36-A1 TaxID=3252900 RepID=UPI003C2EE2A0
MKSKNDLESSIINTTIAQKLLFLLCNIIILMLNDSLIISVIYITILLLMYSLYNKTMLHKAKLLLTLSIFTVIAIIPILFVFDNSNIIVSLYSLNITEQSLQESSILFFRSFAMMLNMLVFISYANINELLIYLERIRFPKLLISLMLLTYRLIHLLLHKAKIISNAQHIRLGYINYRRSLKSLSYLLANSFTKSINQSQEINNSMELRFFNTLIPIVQSKKSWNITLLYLQIILFTTTLFIKEVYLWKYN